jgi:hypothetical protein
MKPEDHNRLLGWSHIVWAGLFALLGLFCAVMFGFVGLMAAFEPRRHNDPPEAFFFLFAIIFGFIYIGFSIPSFIAGIGLLKQKRWAKIWAIIGAVLSAMSFPIGTAVCVYTFWFLFSDPGKILYEGAAPNAQRDPAPLYSAPADAYWSGSEAKTREYQYVPPSQPPNWRDES